MDGSRIYLDYAATTPLLPQAREAMLPWLGRDFGNPSSLHAEGRRAKAAIDQAREAVATALACEFGEVVFTSGGTESVNLAIIGAALAGARGERKRILMGAADHHCVLNTRGVLEPAGFVVEPVPVDREARIRLDALESALGPDVLLVSLMHANNEFGTVQAVRDAADLARRHGSLVHCDCVQTFLQTGLRWRPDDLSADLVSLSAHKCYGPRGAGALYVRSGTPLRPLSVGGGQEREMRAGTENVAAIAGFGAAVAALASDPPADTRAARDRFLDRVVGAGAVASVSSGRGDRSRAMSSVLDVLPGHAHVRIPGIDAETILIRLDRMGVSASSGAACSSGSLEPSHVMLAAGYAVEEARQGLRFTFGRGSTVSDAEEAASRVIAAARAISDA